MTAIDRASMTVHLPILFRLAQRSDLSKLEWYGQYSHFRALIRRAFREQTRGRRFMLLADLNGFPIGQIFVQLESNNDQVADGYRRAYLYSFRVMEMFQGQGIGSRLLREAEGMLAARYFQYATLSVAKENERALKLYQRSGYRVFDDDPGQWHYVDHRGVKHHVNEPSWMLEKKLSRY